MDHDPHQPYSEGYGQTGKSSNSRRQPQQYEQSTRQQGYNTDNPLGPTSLKLSPNLSGALCYVGWWITGLIFFFAERKSSFVRFHAIQSTLTFIVVSIIWAILRAFFSIPLVGAVGCFLGPIFGALAFVLWAGLIILALLGKEVRIPIIGDFAARCSGRHQLRPEIS